MSDYGEEWIYDGRECEITLNDKLGIWCGYTKTTLQFETSDIYYMGHHLLEVHGGITYGPDDDGKVGFDCGHAGDICYDRNGVQTTHDMLVFETRNEWHPENVIVEVENLADQLTLLENFIVEAGESDE